MSIKISNTRVSAPFLDTFLGLNVHTNETRLIHPQTLESSLSRNNLKTAC